MHTEVSQRALNFCCTRQVEWLILSRSPRCFSSTHVGIQIPEGGLDHKVCHLVLPRDPCQWSPVYLDVPPEWRKKLFTFFFFFPLSKNGVLHDKTIVRKCTIIATVVHVTILFSKRDPGHCKSAKDVLGRGDSKARDWLERLNRARRKTGRTVCASYGPFL